MRIHPMSGVLCFALAATAAAGGDAPKDAPFRELTTEDVGAIAGDWEAKIKTKKGWKGTLRASISLKRNHPETSTFHHWMVLKYDLRFVDQKTSAAVGGTEKRALIPFQKGTHRYVQFLRDSQVLQREFLDEVLDMRPNDKAALKAFAALQPTRLDTAQLSVLGEGWSLEMAPVVLGLLPRNGSPGPNIDWDTKIVWTKAK